MSLDGKLLAQAREKLRERRISRENELLRREDEVARRTPRVRELIAEMTQTMSDIATALVDHTATPQFVDGVRRRNLALQNELARVVEAAGFTRGYLDDAPHCKICGDTGYNGTSPCDCLMVLYRAEQKNALSSLLKAGDERFENFDLSFYEAQADGETGISPREHMRFVYNVCVSYAKTFGKSSMNLFLSGQPGLGKTFLAACIARQVAESGEFSVVYDTFPAIFTRLEDEKFGRTDEALPRDAETRRYRECDLLIADDLGAELRSNFATAALYELLNTRITTKKRTIITSNLSVSDIRQRYSPQIASRVEGEFQVLTFYGKDIRVQKNNKM